MDEVVKKPTNQPNTLTTGTEVDFMLCPVLVIETNHPINTSTKQVTNQAITTNVILIYKQSSIESSRDFGSTSPTRTHSQNPPLFWDLFSLSLSLPLSFHCIFCLDVPPSCLFSFFFFVCVCVYVNVCVYIYIYIYIYIYVCVCVVEGWVKTTSYSFL